MPGFWTSFFDCIFCRSPKDSSDEQFRKGKAAFEKYKASRVQKDLDEAIGYFDLALNSRRPPPEGGPPHVDLDVTLTTCASALFARYQIKPSPADLHRAIELDEEAYGLYEHIVKPNDRPPEYTNLLFNLGEAYFRLYVDTRAPDSFNKAIKKYGQLRDSLNAPAELKRKGNMKMAIALTTWCDQEESAAPRDKKGKLEQAIELFEEVKDATGQEQSAEKQDEPGNIREKCLFHLAIAHHARYSIEKDLTGLNNAIVDLDKAIQYNREARKILLQTRHPELLYCLFDLAQQLFAKYEFEQGPVQPQLMSLSAQQQNKGLKELLEAKDFAREAMALKEINEDKNADLKRDLEDLLNTVEKHSQHSLV